MKNQAVDERMTRIGTDFGAGARPIPVELSARHVHLSAEDVERLFGQELTAVRELSQPGQFLSKERVRLIGPGGQIENVAVLGPARGRTQVEISLTDARTLGVSPPVRQSGDTAGSAAIRIATERGTVQLDEGLLIPGRHLHLHPDDACAFGLRDGDFIKVRVGDERALIFERVLVRVNAEYRLAMHIDFDEGNACGWQPGTSGILIRDPGDCSKVSTKSAAVGIKMPNALKKGLVTEKDILEAHNKGISLLRVACDALLTPLAVDCARARGIQLQKAER
jgi:propanediol utilization protein